MSKPATSMLVVGIYMLIIGAVLLSMPKVMLTVFTCPTTDEVGIRLLGLVVAILGYYDIVAARHELVDFFKATVYARPVVILVFTVFVVPGMAKPILILFGAADLPRAMWTGLALRFL